METVTVRREVARPPEEVREAMRDVERFMEAAGFDEVTVEGDRVTIANNFAIARIELDLTVIDDPDAAFAYEQREGIFEEMTTRYRLTETARGTEITATTEFAIDVGLVGGFLDATVIKRQRRRELNAQFDALEPPADW